MSYAWYDGDGGAADDEALENQRHDADIEQYEMELAGAAIAAAERRGVCTHGSAVGYRGGPRSAQQQGLRPGQLRCTKGTGGCSRVFADDDDWFAAMDAAVNG
jgi:hypothetical protein